MIRVAAIGAGYFSQFHFMGWQRIPEARLVAIADREKSKAEAMGRRFDVGASFGDAEAMLDSVAPDLVDVIAPPDAHAALVGAAMKRRIPVICQKSFGRSYEEALRLTQLGEVANVPLVVHENVRWQPWNREAKRLVDAGHLGRLHCVAFRSRPGDGQGPEAYLDRQPYFQKMPQLLVRETAIHWIDTFRFLVGEIVAVYARLRRLNPVIAGEDAGYIVFEFAGGEGGVFDGNRLNDHVATDTRRTLGEMWLEGSAGVLRLDGEARLWWKPHHGEEREHRYSSGPRDTFGGGACENLQRHVVQHFTDGSPLENTARQYLTNLRVQDAVYQSHEEMRRIEVGSK